MNASLCMPTRGRAEQAARAIENAFETTAGHDVQMIVVSHPDLDAIRLLPPLQDQYPKCKVLFRDCTAIEGWNVAASRATGDWLKVWDDDLWAMPGWLDAVERKWHAVGSPNIAYIGLWDRHHEVPHSLYTRAIGTRKFFTEVCGGVLTIPSYASWYDDKEKFDRATAAGCAYYCREAIIEHRHPAYGFPSDATYELGAQRHGNDGHVYQSRKSSGFANDYLPVIR